MTKYMCSINVPHINFNQKISENSKYITRSLLLSRNRVDIELGQTNLHENGLDYFRSVGATVHSDR
jgi:hypothetical protein